jgi:hypothetical protein
MITRVEFTLDNQTQITYQLIDIQDIRSLFPEDEVEFTIHADNIAYKRKLHKQNYASYDHFHLRPWFDEHPSLKSGDKLAIDIVKPMKEYNLKII